ncbi:sugar phosphate isomerase/epimerase family protein [Zunongwangia pacifica]|uniref:Sugar phosphate isomerase/epimerase n=1 Tax=Zunongwangia pacifica TaxID=2911062 RepID=A0A9X1ZPR3_9FLAO|nr:sugar phosphate isomerase/epimerase [Zunongwangia pacifica]MCL6217030.1 sugar phosphate isomerase/epimerase [Zunongwangia pacifica]
MSYNNSRRGFIKGVSCLGIVLLNNKVTYGMLESPSRKVPLSGHVWVYASRFPPDWDCTPILEQAFADFQAAGLEGMEFMESNLRNDNIIELAGELINKYEIPVTGTSYYGDMWDKDQHQEIFEDLDLILDRLHKLNGKTLGITVGDAGRMKTTSELDDQGILLQRILKLSEKYKIQPNLHNHTFEVEHDLYDFKGTIERVPELKIGPDINWLIRAGVDPIAFIRKYGNRMVYLHIRDQDANGNWTRAVGQGVTDFTGIAQVLKDVDFDGRAAIELAFEEPSRGSVREEWKESRNYVKNIFGW